MKLGQAIRTLFDPVGVRQEPLYSADETAPLVVTRLEDRRVLACTSSVACLDENGASSDQGDSIGPNAIGDPVVTVPGTQSTTEGSALVFSAATGNLIRVDDPDIGANPMTVQIAALEVMGGVSPNITLGSTAGLLSISGNGSNLIQLQGTLAAINAALAHVTFYSIDDGNYSVTVSADDPSTGGSDSKTFSVLAANGLPQIALDNTSDAQEGSLIDLSIQVFDPGTYDSPTTSWAVVFQGTQIAQGVGSHVVFVPPNDGDYEVTVNAVDKDGGAAMIQEHLFVGNVAPESNLTGFVRDGITHLTVVITDPGADLFTIEVYWSSNDAVPDVIMTTQRVVTLSHDYSLDDVPPEELFIAVQVSDGEGSSRDALRFAEAFTEVTTPPQIEPIVTLPPPERSAAVRPRLDGATPQVNGAQTSQGSVVGRQEQPAVHQFVVRLVGPDGEESGSFPLAYEALANLPAFFASIGLPDGHYRVYLVTGELERLVVDAHLRSGRLIDPAAESLAALDGAPASEVVDQMPGVTDRVELDRLQAGLLVNTETVTQGPVDEAATPEIAQISTDNSAPQIVSAAIVGTEQSAETAESSDATLRWAGSLLVGLGVSAAVTLRTHSVRARAVQPRRNRFSKAARLARRIARQIT